MKHVWDTSQSYFKKKNLNTNDFHLLNKWCFIPVILLKDVKRLDNLLERQIRNSEMKDWIHIGLQQFLNRLKKWKTNSWESWTLGYESVIFCHIEILPHKVVKDKCPPPRKMIKSTCPVLKTMDRHPTVSISNNLNEIFAKWIAIFFWPLFHSYP